MFFAKISNNASLLGAVAVSASLALSPSSVSAGDGATSRPTSQAKAAPRRAAESRPTTAPATLKPLPEAKAGPAKHLVQKIEKAHGADAWRSHEAFQARVAVNFGGGRMTLDGLMTFDPSVGRVRMELDNGHVYVFDGKTAWVSPADAEAPRARFHLLTWPYFAAAPFKLADPGSNFAFKGEMNVREGEAALAGKLTFDAGVGDAPEDWYLVYSDPETGQVEAMAYIVTYGKTAAEAGEAHAIVYDDYQDVDGAKIATKWTFADWDEANGVHDNVRGEVSLSQMKFVAPAPGAFERPADSVEQKLPGAK